MKMQTEMKAVEIAPGVSMIEVMRRFRLSPDTRIIKAECQSRDVPPRKPRPGQDEERIKPKNKQVDVWKILFVGPEPEALAGLLYKPQVEQADDYSEAYERAQT